MEDSPAVQLIAVEIQYPEFAALINDIRDFDWKIVNHLRKEDLARIQSTGYHFKSKGIENQKQEFKSFLFEHPSCMASDLEMIIYKLNVFARIVSPPPSLAPPPQPKPQPTKQAIKYQKPQKRTRKPKKKVVIIEEEEDFTDFTEEESSEDYTEEDTEYIPRKRSRKSH